MYLFKTYHKDTLVEIESLVQNVLINLVRQNLIKFKLNLIKKNQALVQIKY